jgi:hypothetical protein
LYIKASPSINDRNIINSLLTNDTLIPEEMIYRPNDIYFGKATSIVYEHAYGIYSSDIDEYLAAVTQNHYWRNITLGEIKTAVAKNSLGEIIYEVVYSEVIDNLVNPSGTSIQQEIVWPRPIDLGLGPWYTSITDIYTSYETVLGQEYYTSLTPGYARLLCSIIDKSDKAGKDQLSIEAIKTLINWSGSHEVDDIAPTIYYKWLFYVLQYEMQDEIGLEDFDIFLSTHLMKTSIPLLLKNDSSAWWDNISTKNYKETRIEICTKAFNQTIKDLQNQL